jgi:hypothetical protein
MLYTNHYSALPDDDISMEETLADETPTDEELSAAELAAFF